MTYKIDISHRTILFFLGVLLILWFVYLIIDVILLFFVAFILMSTIGPLVSRLTAWKVPRPLAIFFIFLLIVVSFVTLLTLGFTPLISQTSNLSQRLGETLTKLLQANLVDKSVIDQETSNISHQILNLTVDVFRNFISFVSVVVITFYLLLDKDKLEDLATSFFMEHRQKARKFLDRIEEKLGAWLRGQVVLSLIVGVAVYIGLTVLGMEFALPLAIIAALMEVIPVIGPIISAVPALLIALTISPISAALVGGLYLAVQQIESHVIVPQVMKRAVGLNPILVILSVAIGSRLLGIGGALLAVPIAVVIQVALEETLALPDELVSA